MRVRDVVNANSDKEREKLQYESRLRKIVSESIDRVLKKCNTFAIYGKKMY